MIGNLTVGARLHVDVCKTNRGCDGDEKRRVILCYDGDVLDWGGVIGFVPAFGLVRGCSPAADIRHLLLGHVCLCLSLRHSGCGCVHVSLVIGVDV